MTSPTVNATIQRLQREGLVISKPYRSIFLTDNGRALAESSKQRHDVVRNFLIEIGVEPSVAEEDAEGVEHHVSPETLEKFSEFLKKSGH